MNSLPYAGRLLIVMIVVLIASEIAPRFVNWVLAVILLGLVLTNYESMRKLLEQLGATFRLRR